MAGHSRPKDGVASLAYVPAIHDLSVGTEDVDARNKSGHDGQIPIRCRIAASSASSQMPISTPPLSCSWLSA